MLNTRSIVWLVASCCVRAVALAVVASSPVSAQSAKEASAVASYHLRVRAESALNSRQYEEAEPLYDSLAIRYRKDGQFLYERAVAKDRLGKAAEAATAYVDALRNGAWPRAEVAYRIAQLRARLGERDVALAWVDSALVNRLKRRSRLQSDSAFISYRDDPRFRKQAGMLPPGTITRDAGWRFDIALFVDEAQRLSVAPTRPAFSTSFVNAAAELSRQVPHLSDADIMLGLARLASSLGDGHSYLVRRLATVPLQFYRFSDGLFIIKGAGAGVPLVGSRVIRIGRVTADSAMRVIASLASQDNEMMPLWQGVAYLASPGFLHAAGLSDDSASIKLEIAGGTGGVRTVNIARDTVPLFGKLAAPKPGDAAIPLWLQRAQDNHWLTKVPEMDAVYAQYNQVRNAKDQTVAQFAAKVTAALAESRARNLIVDVRHNNGGNRIFNTPLLLAMAAFKQESPDHRVFIATGRGTFSAAQVFISQAEWMVDPIYIGEPSSSRPNFVGEESEVFLPYSKAVGSVSNQYHQGTTFQDERPFIAPQILVDLSSADYFGNRDPVMETLKMLLRK
ncbi:MAG: hypothetical protein M3P12_09930 [Gemmatimonadota bacterium]|nr:hypothetical protein [Gemmatimonadota bacterium]